MNIMNINKILFSLTFFILMILSSCSKKLVLSSSETDPIIERGIIDSVTLKYPLYEVVNDELFKLIELGEIHQSDYFKRESKKIKKLSNPSIIEMMPRSWDDTLGLGFTYFNGIDYDFLHVNLVKVGQGAFYYNDKIVIIYFFNQEEKDFFMDNMDKFFLKKTDGELKLTFRFFLEGIQSTNSYMLYYGHDGNVFRKYSIFSFDELRYPR